LEERLRMIALRRMSTSPKKLYNNSFPKKQYLSKSSEIISNNEPGDSRLNTPDDRVPLYNASQPPLIQELLRNNRHWARQMVRDDPEYFSRLATQQSPQILWIGCSDSRVPANQILNLAPGEVFVYRNIANIFIHTDFSALLSLSTISGVRCSVIDFSKFLIASSSLFNFM